MRLIDYVASAALGLGTLTGCGKTDPPKPEQRLEHTVHAITKDNFDGKVLKPHLAVVKLHADWCPPCRESKPHYESFAGTYKAVTFGVVDIDKEKELASLLTKEHRIDGIPAFLFYKDGKYQDKIAGWPGADAWQRRMAEIYHHECCKPPK